MVSFFFCCSLCSLQGQCACVQDKARQGRSLSSPATAWMHACSQAAATSTAYIYKLCYSHIRVQLRHGDLFLVILSAAVWAAPWQVLLASSLHQLIPAPQAHPVPALAIIDGLQQSISRMQGVRQPNRTGRHCSFGTCGGLLECPYWPACPKCHPPTLSVASRGSMHKGQSSESDIVAAQAHSSAMHTHSQVITVSWQLQELIQTQSIIQRHWTMRNLVWLCHTGYCLLLSSYISYFRLTTGIMSMMLLETQSVGPAARAVVKQAWTRARGIRP